MALPAFFWTPVSSVGDYDSGGYPRVWSSLNFLYGLFTIAGRY